jgi:hypothetical protein
VLVGDQACALVAYIRHGNDQDPVDIYDAHSPPVDMVRQGEMTHERTCIPLTVMAHRIPSVTRCSVVFSSNAEDIGTNLKTDILILEPWQLDLNYKGRIAFRYSTPRVPFLDSRPFLPGPGLVDELPEEAAHFLSHIESWPWALRRLLHHSVPAFMVSDRCGVRYSYVHALHCQLTWFQRSIPP